MRCYARNIERLTRIPNLRMDLPSRFMACSFFFLGSMNALGRTEPSVCDKWLLCTLKLDEW